MQILTIDKMKEGVNDEILTPHLPQELAATINLYLEEKIRTFYFRKDRPGVVFILECESIEEVRKTLDQLPLVQEGLLDFEYIPLGPLEPLKMLF
ncbi:hypothetical protein [Aquimarina algiphila]|uniref:hypothetical protein n=1 Tax=Aquimarina algiphila TaxID=2047982 RepID=UPI002491E9DD|nr:hypothetical protein [Aquimarina algiphila]